MNSHKNEIKKNRYHELIHSTSERAPLQPPPDNSDLDMGSSVSFNTGVLYDQFDNMDSIS